MLRIVIRIVKIINRSVSFSTLFARSILKMTLVFYLIKFRNFKSPSLAIAHLRIIVRIGAGAAPGKRGASGVVQLIIVSERSARADAQGVTTARLGDYHVRHDYANRHVPTPTPTTTTTTTTTTTMTTMTTLSGERETGDDPVCASVLGHHTPACMADSWFL